MFVLFLIFVIVVLLVIFLIFMVWGFLSVGPWVGTSSENLNILFETLGPADGRKLLDVGSGDGRIVLEAGRRGFDASGIEINPVLHLISSAKAAILKEGNRAHFQRKNLWYVSFAPYDIVVCFVFPAARYAIEEKFQKEGKREAQLIFLKQHKGLEVVIHG